MAMHSEAQALPGLALSWRQLAGVAGIVGVILFVIGFGLMADAPTANDSVDNVRSWFEDNGSRLLAAYYLITIGAVIFLVPFFLGLRSLLAEAEGGEALWTQLGFLGGVLFIVLEHRHDLLGSHQPGRGRSGRRHDNGADVGRRVRLLALRPGLGPLLRRNRDGHLAAGW